METLNARCARPVNGHGGHLWASRRAGWVARARSFLVGRVLQDLRPASDIPWHRVVNAKGEVSCSPCRNGSDVLQQRLLKKEDVQFDDRNRFNLERSRWPE
jgi:methylated-DNA-protein-cysteine methyltransferase-like protein